MEKRNYRCNMSLYVDQPATTANAARAATMEPNHFRFCGREMSDFAGYMHWK